EDYLKQYEKHPCIEYLAKIGLTQIIEDHLPGYYYSTMGNFNKTNPYYYGAGLINLDGVSLKEVLPQTNKQDIPLLIRANASAEIVRVVAKERKKGKTCEIKDLQKMMELCRNDESIRKAGQALKYCSLSKTVKYLQTLKSPEEKVVTQWKIGDWIDYLRMAETARWDMQDNRTLYPADLKAAHDLAEEQCEVEKNSMYDGTIKELACEYKKQFSFAKNGLTIVVPESGEEIVREGKKQKHCVWRYVASVADEKSIILFIRKEAEPDKPYYTLEINPRKKIEQCRGYCNAGQTPEIEKFLKAFEIARLHKKPTEKAV
ncbi:MAG: PcfJ domain-containing protein, partial [Oscillospiraceae bacterium]